MVSAEFCLGSVVGNVEYWKKASQKSFVLFGAKLGMALTFIITRTLIDAEARSGFAMSGR